VNVAPAEDNLSLRLDAVVAVLEQQLDTDQPKLPRANCNYSPVNRI
jgi:hypothetical protein